MMSVSNMYMYEYASTPLSEGGLSSCRHIDVLTHMMVLIKLQLLPTLGHHLFAFVIPIRTVDDYRFVICLMSRGTHSLTRSCKKTKLYSGLACSEACLLHSQIYLHKLLSTNSMSAICMRTHHMLIADIALVAGLNHFYMYISFYICGQ